MNKTDTLASWAPKILGRERLDERRWIIVVEAPFDMPADIPDLIGKRTKVADADFDIHGSVPKMPTSPIMRGEPIALLVSATRL